MVQTIKWDLFESTYVRAELADIYGDQFDQDILQKTTYSVISNLRMKGCLDLGPTPSTTTTPATVEKQNILINNLSAGNIIYITIDNTTITHTTTGADLEVEITAITNAINNDTTINAIVSATDRTSFVELEGLTPGKRFELIVVANLGSGDSNPSVNTQTIQRAKKEEDILVPITELTADYDAWPMISSGISWFLQNDAITRAKTTSGLDISKDRQLTVLAKSNYDQLTLAYLCVNNITNPSAEYWKTKLQTEIATIQAGENANNDLTFEQRLALLNAEYDRKIEQDDNTYLDTGINDRLLEDERLNHEKILRELNRTYELKDRNNLEQKNATNGAWTPAGQFTQTFVSEYFTPLEDTVQKDTMNITNDYLGLTDLVNSGVVLTSNRINVSEFDLLELDLQATEAVEYTFYSSQDGSIFTQVSNSTISSNITKKYHLPPSKYIKIGIKGLSNNTYFYIEASLRK